MPITIHPATLRDMTFIAANMREQDRREIRAVIQATDTEIGAMLFAGSPSLAWCAWIDDTPVAAFGISPGFHGTGSAWAYGTKRMLRAVPAMTRWVNNHIVPLLDAEGYRRVEVRTAIDHDVSHRWLANLGFVRECVVKDYGADGLDFVQYAITRRIYPRWRTKQRRRHMEKYRCRTQ